MKGEGSSILQTLHGGRKHQLLVTAKQLAKVHKRSVTKGEMCHSDVAWDIWRYSTNAETLSIHVNCRLGLSSNSEGIVCIQAVRT